MSSSEDELDASEITPKKYWSSALCPRCQGGLSWFCEGGDDDDSDGDGITITSDNGTQYDQMCCDVDEAFCKRCNIHLPICPICTYVPKVEEVGYGFTDFTVSFRSQYPSRPEPKPGDLQFLTFLGCGGEIWYEGKGGTLSKPNREGPYSVENIGIDIPYIIDHPLPGCDQSILPDNMCVVGTDGGGLTYWWCPKCKLAQHHENK